MAKRKSLYVDGELSDLANERFEALSKMGFTNPSIVYGALNYVLELSAEDLIRVYGILASLTSKIPSKA